MSELVEGFREKIDELGKRRALEWLKSKVTDAGVLQAATLWADNPDQPWAREAFRGAISAMLGTTPSSHSDEPDKKKKKKHDDTVADLLKAILADQKLPDSLKPATLRDYLRDLRRSVERVNSLGIKADVTDGKAPRLEKIYVERRASVHECQTDADEKEMRFRNTGSEADLFKALVTRPRAVITAGPGIGKTFLFRHLCLHLTDPDLGKTGPNFEPSVPIFVSLRKFAPWLQKWRACQDESAAQPGDLTALWEFLEEEWSERYFGLVAGIREWLDADPLANQRVTFLFDGLDEVPIERGDRVWVSELLMEMELRFPKLSIYGTCRVRSYEFGERPWGIYQKDYEPSDSDDSLDWLFWPIVEIQPFDPHEIEQFIQGWFEELNRSGWFDRERAKELAESFSEALGNREDLQKLASSPLMLTLMCIIHGTQRELPNGRGGLYHQLIGLMLGEWEKERLEAARGGEDRFANLCRRKAEISGGKALSTADFLRKLGELVFRLTEEFSGSKEKREDEEDDDEGEGSGILIPESDLEDLLYDLCLGGRKESEFSLEQVSEARVWREEMLGFIKEHGGLLDQVEGAGSDFAFPHRQYGEFLAGWYLVHHHPEKYGRLTSLCDSFEDWNDLWREPVLFGISWLASQDGGNTVSRFVQELTGADPEVADPVKLHMAGEILAEYGDPDYFRGNANVWETVRQSLLKRMLAESDTVQERIRFGLSLGQMGDPREGVGIDSQSGLPDIRWSEELMPPAEGFLMGSEDSEKEAFDDEKPQFICKGITAPFRMAIHPVTVSQYLAFVKAGGYQPDNEERWWTEAGRKWKAKNGISGPAFINRGTGFNVGSHPVTDVNFFEAVAFCRWLRDAGEADEQLRAVRLPNEMEWEFAARGPEGRRYPWGNDAGELASRCHFDATGIDHPSAVGLFGSKGRAIDSKVEDLSGNVWEWTGSEWEDNFKNYTGSWAEEGEQQRALRGGSFGDGSRVVRAAFRNWVNPESRYRFVGFRVVSSPFETPET